MGRLPEGAHLLCLTSGWEHLSLDGEAHEVFEVIDSRIGEATLPIGHSTTPDS